MAASPGQSEDKPDLPVTACPVPIEPLSQRELEVLRLLAKGIERPGNCPTS